MLSSPLLATVLARWVTLVARRAWVTLLACVVLSGVAWQYTVTHIGINTDTADMISAELPWRQRYIELGEALPELGSTLTIVVDGPDMEAAALAADELAAALARGGAGIRSVRVPGLDPFFLRNGLLYQEIEELEAQATRLVAAQPVLGRLAAEPRLANLLELLAELPGQDLSGQRDALARLMDGLVTAIEQAGGESTWRLSWQALMRDEPVGVADRRQFVLVDADLDYGELLPAGPVIRHVRDQAEALGLERRHGARVRITGATAMAHEEMHTVSSGMGVAALLALLLVSGVLLVGLRGWRAVLAVMLTLVMGLVWTAAFAAWSVGKLNLISIAFAVLYIGLGVDYAVHFCLRLRELGGEGADDAGAALAAAARDVGTSLVLCAVTTGIGFFAFVPTDFAGVSELGIISGTGMFISLVASLTALPALLVLLGVAGGGARQARPRAPLAGRRSVLYGAGAAAIASAALLPAARFDHNPVHLRDAATESVATYLELLDSSASSPWTLSVLGDAAGVQALAPRLQALPVVDATRTLGDFVPDGQDDKLLLIDELGFVLGPTLRPTALPATAPDPARLDAALRAAATAAGALDDVDPALREAAARLAGAIDTLLPRLAAAPLLAADLERRVLAYLPLLLDRIDLLLQAGPVTLDSLPEALRQRWLVADGRWRLEIRPAEDLDDNAALARFVAEVQSVAPAATGTPEVNLRAGQVVVQAFTQAFVSAALLIMALLWLLVRNLHDVALVLAPLLLAMLLTTAAMTLLGIPFNFANVIALPLLLGIGVDNGIHMVHRARGASHGRADLLGSSTARAIVLSALTTICGFGNLAYSSHPGTASMGQVLSIGLALTLLATLVVLPALLQPAPPDPEART